MAKQGKRLKAVYAGFDRDQSYALTEAVKIAKTNAKAKFDETIEISMNLGIDPRHADQAVRGMIELPNGTGKSVRVAVFCPPGEKANAALAAGADIVGMDDLAEKMQAGDLNYDRVIATPDAMRVVGKLGQVLGPRGLMPNPKDGSVAADVVTAVKNAKAGQVRFRNDKAGIIHCTIGKVNFDSEKLSENLGHLLTDLIRAKPAAAKGIFVQKVSLSSTMGVGVIVDPSSLSLK